MTWQNELYWIEIKIYIWVGRDEGYLIRMCRSKVFWAKEACLISTYSKSIDIETIYEG